jgi:hypothetical protein
MSDQRRVMRLLIAILMVPTLAAAAEDPSVEHVRYDPPRYPPRLKRSESFLGVHFDFHAGPDCQEVGKRTTRESIERLLESVRPDYVQIDCKGHPGFSSYPTRVGTPAPGFVGNPLRLWREVTAEKGVGLFMHYSGVFDAQAVARHPEWARVDEKGARDGRMTSVFGPYVDELLIPQLKELADEYDVDGVWVDGECWAVDRDYAEPVVQAFQEQTGIQSVPRTRADPGWHEFSEFCREGFRRYLRRYVDELHRHDGDFQIASNWAFSSFMPEKVSVDVDFISGDYTPTNSLNSARLEGRCMALRGKPWDLMAWSFSHLDGLISTKTARQLEQEAAVVMALGGGFQMYFPQRRDGSVREWQVPIMADVARFCRARQPFCHRAALIPQIGLIYSTSAFYRTNRMLFAPWNGELVPLQGVLQSLLDSQNVVDVVSEHHLAERIDRYPLLIYPEWETIEPAFKQSLVDYVKQGGSLLVIGPRSAGLFQEELDVRLEGAPVVQVSGLEFGGHVAGIRSVFQKATLGDRAKPFGQVRLENEVDGPAVAAASIARLGEGVIAATYLCLGERYATSATTVSRDFLAALVSELFPAPLVEVQGSHHVDVTAARLGDRLLVNLVNTAGPHANAKVNVHDDIPSVGPLTLSIRCPPPASVLLQPDGRSVAYEFRDDRLHVTVPRVEIHDIIEIVPRVESP